MLSPHPAVVAAFFLRHNLLHAFESSWNSPFKGLYTWNLFDALLLTPYFLVMIVLGIYGMHRYQLMWLYYRNKKKAQHSAGPEARFAELPFVTVQLPIFNEQFVIDRLIDAVCRLEYPRDRFEVQVLDDSTDETTMVASAIVARYAQGFPGMPPQPIVYLHRDNREGFKAGALDAGLKVAKGEYIAIFDADFVPPQDWLLRVIQHFAVPPGGEKIGMVQTRWTHLNRDYSMLTEVEAMLLDGHFVMEHGGRSRSDVFFNFNGTAGMWKRDAIDDAGGWQHDTLTEDTDLSYRAQLRGWRFKYLQDVECPSELPIEMTAFKTQQARWAKGLIQTSIKILPRMMRSKEPWHVKLETIYHLTANLSYPFMLVLCVMMLPVMIVRFSQGYYQMLFIDLPLFVSSTISISLFYLSSEWEIDRRHWLRALMHLPLLMALGIGLTVTNSKAVLEALFGIRSAFVRTPKYRVQKKGEKSQARKYRKRLGWIPWVEVAIGLWFGYTIVYAIGARNYFTVPFLGLFAFGYLYTGFLSLMQGRFERFSMGNSEAHEKPFPVGV